MSGAAEGTATTGRGLLAAVEELFLIPTYASAWAPAWVAAHRGLALPFQLRGRVHRYTALLDGQEVRVAGVGRWKHLEPLSARLLGPTPPVQSEGSRVLVSPDRLADIEGDLVLAAIHRWMAPRFRRAGWEIIPDAVRWQGELSAVPPVEPCRSLREDFRKVRKAGYTLEPAGSQADWQEFHERMVVPQAMSRHGDDAWIPSSRFMRALAAAGGLHFVKRHGERVAGACWVGHGTTIWLPISGLRGGSPALLREGAGTAALLLVFDWARAQGYTRLDLGRTSPFVRDGIQQYKRKWGLRPVHDPLTHVLALRAGPRVRELLAREPVLVEDGAGIAVFAGAAA